MDLDPDPDPWKILWIRIRQNDADPLDPDPQHCCTLIGILKVKKNLIQISDLTFLAGRCVEKLRLSSIHLQSISLSSTSIVVIGFNFQI